MNEKYLKLLQNLNVAKWELKSRKDPTLNVCIKYIDDAIFEAKRLNAKYVELMLMQSMSSADSADDWCE